MARGVSTCGGLHRSYAVEEDSKPRDSEPRLIWEEKAVTDGCILTNGTLFPCFRRHISESSTGFVGSYIGEITYQIGGLFWSKGPGRNRQRNEAPQCPEPSVQLAR